jgi:hypothetical protein
MAGKSKICSPARCASLAMRIGARSRFSAALKRAFAPPEDLADPLLRGRGRFQHKTPRQGKTVRLDAGSLALRSLVMAERKSFERFAGVKQSDDGLVVGPWRSRIARVRSVPSGLCRR